MSIDIEWGVHKAGTNTLVWHTFYHATSINATCVHPSIPVGDAGAFSVWANEGSQLSLSEIQKTTVVKVKGYLFRRTGWRNGREIRGVT